MIVPMEKVLDMPAPGNAPAVRENGAKPGRGRPRSEVSHEAILSAVLDLLRKEGYQGITIEGVARHAGVGKQTIYRWWRCRAEIVLEAYANHAASKVPVPDSGEVRADLETFLSTAFCRLNKVTGGIMRGLMADAVLDADFGGILRDVFLLRRRQALSEILRRGVARGELRTDVDLDVVIDLISGAMWFRLMVQHGKLDVTFARELAKLVLGGAAVSAPVERAPSVDQDTLSAATP